MEKNKKNLLKKSLIAFSVLTVISAGALAVSAAEITTEDGSLRPMFKRFMTRDLDMSAEAIEARMEFLENKERGERLNPEDCPLLSNLSEEEKAEKIAEIEAHRAEMDTYRAERRALREANGDAGLRMGQLDENGEPLHRGLGRGQMRNISE